MDSEHYDDHIHNVSDTIETSTVLVASAHQHSNLV